MTVTRVIAIGLLAAALLITGASFIWLNSVNAGSDGIQPLDKAALTLDRAGDYLKYGNGSKAVTAYLSVIELYPGTGYAEKAIRGMAALYDGKGDLNKARYYYEKLVADFPNAGDADKVRARINDINMKLMASSSIDEEVIIHEVKPGDSLYGISRKYGVTVGLIKMANGLNSDVIRLGQKLKIVTSKFSIYVDKARNILILEKDGAPFKQYPVSTGRDNSTPVGTFKIIDKVIDAPWTKPTGEIVLPGDPEYELGSRWMAIDKPGYGIHGTNDETTIGGQVTAGCVRMYNKDVIELYDMVPTGTTVTIVDSALPVPPAATEDNEAPAEVQAEG